MGIYWQATPVAVEAQDECDYWVVRDTLVCPGTIAVGMPISPAWQIDAPVWLPDRSTSYYPEEVMLYVLQRSMRTLALPIRLQRSVAGALQYVSDSNANCWGSGKSLDDAIGDFEENLLEAYEDLMNAEAPLSRLAQERLEALRRHLEPQGS